MSTPLFSVLIPAYNAQDYLRACLDSILAQDLRRAEILVLNDGSSDDTASICDEYAEKHPDVLRAMHQQNTGLVIARRRLLAAAAGEYIVFVDSDDGLAPDTLSRLTSLISEKNPDIIIYDRYDIDDPDREIDSNLLFPEGFVSKEDVLKKLAADLLNNIWRKVIRRELYDLDADYSPYQKVTWGEDMLQTLPPLRAADTFYYLPLPLYAWRDTPQSMNHTPGSSLIHVRSLLALVHPCLRDMLREYALDDDETLRVFFRTYNYYLWRFIEGQVSAGAEYDRARELWADARALPLTAEAMRYPSAFGSPYRRLVLRAFRARRDRLVFSLLKVRARLLTAKQS